MHDQSQPPEPSDLPDLPAISDRVAYALRAWLRAKSDYRDAQDTANKLKGAMEKAARKLEETVDEEQTGQRQIEFK